MSSLLRHEWYQTDQKVVVSLFMKNAQNRNCKVTIESEKLSLTADDIPQVEFKLADPINVAESSYKVLSVKVEVSLKKLSGERWETLEKVPEKEPLPAVKMQPLESVGVAPKDHKDWDKLAKDLCEKEGVEKAENDAINSLFQKIYSGSSSEIQRAMNKSFTESGGTVLSTNWKEVGTKKVEMKPPEGTEFRGWEK